MTLKLVKNYGLILKIILFLIILSGLSYGAYLYYAKSTTEIKNLESNKSKLEIILKKVNSDLKDLKSQDQYKINKELEALIKKIEVTYDKAVKSYEKLLDLKNISKKTADFDKAFANILSLLSERNYSSAEAELNLLSTNIDKEKAEIIASFQIPANVPENNTPPGSGFQQQVVKSDVGDFLVDIVTADLNSTRVIVDTASDSDCRNDCPVLSLGDYVSRSGAFAGINGSYFCPADYPSCSDKKNSFDTLAMNKNKKYINSDNNVYSTVPAVIFSGNSARFVGQSLQWGRDTGVDAVLAMQPLLVSNGNIAFNGDGEPKRGSKGSRSFVGASGSTVYIGVVFNATVAEAAHVIHAMGIQNALNLDNGGSTALWSGGYKAGPGRNLPNVLLFVGK
ncbi:MAG: phosphodiester glycosidase family protein [Candidatus Roizmanbacteria bacterium]|nr:phosphodiester glycosidase family protein [Candidatus Roizmanbacteria bacterium]